MPGIQQSGIESMTITFRWVHREAGGALGRR